MSVACNILNTIKDYVVDEKITVQLQNNDKPYFGIFSCLQLHQNRYYSIEAAVMSCKPILIFFHIAGFFPGLFTVRVEEKNCFFLSDTLLVTKHLAGKKLVCYDRFEVLKEYVNHQFNKNSFFFFYF